jgi:hypothetical protein
MSSKGKEDRKKPRTFWPRVAGQIQVCMKWLRGLVWYRAQEDTVPPPLTPELNNTANEYAARYRERFMNLGGESLKTMYGFIKGIALTTATIVILQVTLKIWPGLDVSRPLDPYAVLCYIAWAVSFLVLLITYEAPLSGALIIFEMPPFWITLLPALFIVFEFLAFAILAPEVFVSNDLTYVTAWGFKDRLGRWFLINGVYHLAISRFCALAVDYYADARGNMPTTQIGRAWKAYRDAVQEQCLDSLRGGVLSLIAGMTYWLSRENADSKAFLYVAPVLITLMLLGVMRSLRRQYVHRDTVHRIMTEKPTSADTPPTL